MPTKHASTSTTFPKTKLLQLSYFSRIAEMTELTQLCIAKRFSVFPSLSGAGHDLPPPPDPPYPPHPRLLFWKDHRLSLGLERNQVLSLIFKQLAILKFP